MISKETLRKACELAILSRDTDSAVEVVPGIQRLYDQGEWDCDECGTVCCVHGFAHILAYGRRTDRLGYSSDAFHQLRYTYKEDVPDEALWLMTNEDATPEQILEAL